jgi:DNA-binding NarL/FixJ family response regulator
MNTNMARIFLIDDHPAVRQGLKLLLYRESHVLCGEADSKAGTFERIVASSADIAILDLSLGTENGLDLISELRKLGIAVLIYSMHEDAATIEQAFAAGADGYVSKREVADVVYAAVADLLAGKRFVSPLAAQSLACRALTAPPHREAMLSEREQQILVLLGQGEANTDIAAAFGISVRTVETYFSRIISKLNLPGMKELRRHAIKPIQK